MRVIVWGINYAPEPTGIAPYNTDLCDFLVSRGHEVEMVAAFRYYPYWERLPEDRRKLWRRDQMGAVPVHRCWCYLPKQPSALKRIFHELSFCCMSFLRMLTLKRADVVVVVSPPLALGFFAWIACALRRAPFVFHVQDLQPDAAIGLGMLRQGLMIRALYWLEALAYRKASLVSSISSGIIGAFERKGVPINKRLLFPNWLRVQPQDLSLCGDGLRVRRKFGISDSALLALYSGNIGRKQNIGILLEAARLLDQTSTMAREIVIVIGGDGAGRAELEHALAANPCDRVKLLPLLDDKDYADMLAAAQVCLITQAAGTGQYFFPSKLLSALCARVPVIAVADADSELSAAVREGGFGECVPADAPGPLAGTLIQLANDSHLLTSWKAGTSWVDQFARERVLPRFEQHLESLRRTE